jgi:hypothetical protein
VLTFEQVEAVKHSGLDERLGGIRLELLTMLAEPGDDGLTHVTMVFAGDAAIQLRVRALAATLEDFGDPWGATVTPVHDLVSAGTEEP